jgi:hypothetical protein
MIISLLKTGAEETMEMLCVPYIYTLVSIQQPITVAARSRT